MRAKDIQAGRTYAVGQNLQYKGTTAYKYIAVRTSVERRRFSPGKRGWGTPTPTTDGVLMERVESNGLVMGVREVIRSADVHSLWDEYEAMRLKRDESEITAAQRRKEEARELREKLDAYIPRNNQPDSLLFLGYPTSSNREYYTTSVHLSGDQLLEVMQLVLNGRES